MRIESVDIKYYNFSGFTSSTNDGFVCIKQLPYLSNVQSKIGDYKIQLNRGHEYSTGEGGFFIAPSCVTQKITHSMNKEMNIFNARYVFLDVLINNVYRIDDVFDFPVVTDKEFSAVFDKEFDKFEMTDNVCDRMCCLYRIIKHLIEISTPKKLYLNNGMYTVIEFIRNNYTKNISICEMADIVKMSESNFYTVFKKTTGNSPIKYLNEYRLSVASKLLHHTDNSIKAIAEKVGISDQFYFSKLFKAKFAMSPQQYRKTENY